MILNIEKKESKKNNRLKSKKNNFIFNHLYDNAKEYLIVLILFLIGIIVGIVFINNISNEQKVELSEYITDFADVLRQNKQIQLNNLLMESTIKNLIMAVSFWFIGCTVIGLPILYGMIGVRGFFLGYSMAVIVGVFGTLKGALFCISTLLPQNILAIPCILALAVSGIKISKSIFKDKRKENIKVEIYRHTFFCLVMITVLVLSSFVEVYLSTNLIKFFITFI